MEQIIWKIVEHTQLGNNHLKIQPLLPHGSGILLLHQILNMPTGKAISFKDGVVLAYYQEGIYMDGGDIKLLKCFQNSWVKWLSQRGYKIILTNEEFEF